MFLYFFHFAHRLENRVHHLIDCLPADDGALLRQVSQAELSGHADGAAVGLQLPGQDLEKGALAAAVDADKTDPFAVLQGQRSVQKDIRPSEGFGDMLG